MLDIDDKVIILSDVCKVSIASLNSRRQESRSLKAIYSQVRKIRINQDLSNLSCSSWLENTITLFRHVKRKWAIHHFSLLRREIIESSRHYDIFEIAQKIAYILNAIWRYSWRFNLTSLFREKNVKTIKSIYWKLSNALSSSLWVL